MDRTREDDEQQTDPGERGDRHQLGHIRQGRGAGMGVGLEEQGAAGPGQDHQRQQAGAQHDDHDPGQRRRADAGLKDQQLADEARQRRQTGDRERQHQEQPAEQIRRRQHRPGAQLVAEGAARAGDVLGEHEQGGGDQGRLEAVVEAGGERRLAAEAEGGQDAAGRDHHQMRDQERQALAGKRAQGADDDGDQPEHQQPGIDQTGERPGIGAKDQAMDAQDRIGADLGHDREQRGRGRPGRRIGAGQPEMQRRQRRLQGEHHEQQQRRRAHQPEIVRVKRRDPLREIGHVEGAEHAVEGAHREQEQARTDQVDHHIMQSGATARRAAAMQQQPVGGEQQDLEEDEEIEQVAGQEGAVQSHQQELEQHMELTAPAIAALDRVHHREQRQHRGQQHHPGREPVGDQHDAMGRGPAAQRVDQDLAVGDLQQQPQRDAEQHLHAEHAEGASQGRGAAAQQHQQRAGQQRHQDRRDHDMGDGAHGSRPSTWSLPRSARARKASTTTKAVMPKPITIAVSTSACGSGSA